MMQLVNVNHMNWELGALRSWDHVSTITIYYVYEFRLLLFKVSADGDISTISRTIPPFSLQLPTTNKQRQASYLPCEGRFYGKKREVKALKEHDEIKALLEDCFEYVCESARDEFDLSMGIFYEEDSELVKWLNNSRKLVANIQICQQSSTAQRKNVNI